MKNLATGVFYYENLGTFGSEDSVPNVYLPASILNSGDSLEIKSMATSRSSGLKAVGCYNGKVQVLSDGGDIFNDINASDTSEINSVEFSNDGTMIVTGSEDGLVKVWNLSNNELMKTFSSGSSINSATISPNNMIVAAGNSDGQVLAWSMSNEEAPLDNFPFINHGDSVTGVKFISTNSHIVSVSRDTNIKVIDVATGMQFKEHSMSTHAQGINYLDIILDDDGRDIILTGADSGEVRVSDWEELGTVAAEKLVGLVSDVTSVCFGKNFNIRCAVADERMKIWDGAGTIHNIFQEDGKEFSIIASNGFGTIYSTSRKSTGDSGIIRGWSEDNGKEQLFYRCELFNEIISVVVWPDPLKFKLPIVDYPMGPIAGRFPIVCMAKRLKRSIDMNWDVDISSVGPEDIPLRGYYVDNFDLY